MTTPVWRSENGIEDLTARHLQRILDVRAVVFVVDEVPPLVLMYPGEKVECVIDFRIILRWIDGETIVYNLTNPETRPRLTVDRTYFLAPGDAENGYIIP